MEGSHNLSPDAKVRYKKMIDQHNAEEANKKKIKANLNYRYLLKNFMGVINNGWQKRTNIGNWRFRKIIPRKIERKVKTLEAMKDGGMASKKQLEELEKLKKLYPSMF